MSEDLTWLPAWRLAELIRGKDVSPVEVVEHFLGRIEEHQPVLQAIEQLNADRARVDAKAAEAAVLAGESLGDLHGIPMAVKSHLDLEGVAETVPFGSGIAPSDDLTVERLRAAGAIVVGHTNMPVFREDYSLDHAAGARNPWDPMRTPGISSAGSASAVAAGLLPLALCSDGGGSSRIPAAYSGVIGVHSTPGLVPWVNGKRQSSMGVTSTIGAMARDARDVATALAVIAGPDGRDEMGLHVDLADPRSELDLGVAGLRMAWTDDFGFARKYGVEESERVVRHIRDAAQRLASLDACVEETTQQWEDFIPSLLLKHAADGIASMGLTGGGTTPDEAYAGAIATRQRNWLTFRQFFTRYDVLLSPVITSVAPTLDVFEQRIPTAMSIIEGGAGIDHYCVYTAQFNWLKLPSVAVPCGFVDGLPVGLQIIGPAGSDARLLRVAHAYTQAFPQAERPPVS